MAALQDLTGRTFGRLSVVRIDVPHRTDSGRAIAQWFCRCTCGRTTVVTANRLRSGETKSCGCLVREVGAHLRTHGLSGRPEYRVWAAMIDRCHRPKSGVYRYYGGRGIAVCESWRASFQNFLTDLGPRPDGATLERRDNDGAYSPENCCWATRIEQGANKRTNRFVTIRGEHLTVAEAARRYKIPAWTLYRRVYAGLPADDLL